MGNIMVKIIIISVKFYYLAEYNNIDLINNIL